MTGRSTLTGAYRDRTVEIFLKRKRTRHSVSYLVVSMQTRAPKPIESHAWRDVLANMHTVAGTVE